MLVKSINMIRRLISSVLFVGILRYDNANQVECDQVLNSFFCQCSHVIPTETFGFLVFSGDTKWEHWLDMD